MFLTQVLKVLLAMLLVIFAIVCLQKQKQYYKGTIVRVEEDFQKHIAHTFEERVDAHTVWVVLHWYDAFGPRLIVDPS